MGFVTDILSGSKGAGYQAQGAVLDKPVSVDDYRATLRQQQMAQDQQQALMQQLQGQGGIQNQSNVFAQQQNLANMLTQQAAGQGPNPALAQLANTTGQNIQQQAALMAGQRGAGANAGLIARQAAMQGGAAQQQAAGQAALMRAQQQLAAQGALQQQQGMMGNLSTQQVGQQANATNALQNTIANQQGMQLGAINNWNQGQVSNQQSVNAANSAIAGQNAKSQGSMLQGLMGGGSSGAGAAGMAGGGMVGYAEGGQVAPTPTPPPIYPDKDKQDAFSKSFSNYKTFGKHYATGGSVGSGSFLGNFMNGLSNLGSNDSSNQSFGSTLTNSLGALPGAGLAKNLYEKGNNLFNPLVGSEQGKPGSSDMPSNFTQTAAHGGAIKDMTSGGHVPGKAEIKGDSLKNDKVPAMLSPKEIVLPRSITMDPNAPDKARAFVEAILAKQNMRKAK